MTLTLTLTFTLTLTLTLTLTRALTTLARVSVLTWMRTCASRPGVVSAGLSIWARRSPTFSACTRPRGVSTRAASSCSLSGSPARGEAQWSAPGLG